MLSCSKLEQREQRPPSASSMPVNFDELELALDLVSSDGLYIHEAFVCRQTGKIYWRSEGSDLDELEDELPDDIEDETKYALLPTKRDFDLGKPLVLDFARDILPGDLGEIRSIFSRRGAYQKFRSLLLRRNALDEWYKYEAKATKQALRDWCEVKGIEIADPAAPGETNS
jgi:hypothetical protein